MQRVVRLSGIALIVGLMAWSFAQAEDVASPGPTTIPDRLDNAAGTVGGAADGVDGDGSADGDGTDGIGSDGADGAPDSLAFRAGFSPGNYGVLDLPGSEDEDETPDRDLEAVSRPSRRVRPGLYMSDRSAEDCTYDLFRITPDGEERAIGSDHVGVGRVLVEINPIEPDRFSSTSGCGRWSAWRPASEPATVADNGDYWIGDLALGEWRVPEGCYWEEVVGFRGANMYDIIDTGFGPQRIEITDESLGFRIRQCDQPLTHESTLVG